MRWNGYAIVSGGFHVGSREYSASYVARRVRLYVGGTALILDNMVGNDRAGFALDELIAVRSSAVAT